MIDDNYLNSGVETETADYYDAMLSLLKIFQKMLEIQGWDEDDNLYAGEILDFLNIATALADWTADKSERSALNLEQLFGEDTAEIKIQALDKLILARMLVNAVEFILDFEMPALPNYKPKDIDDIFAWKAAKVLLWMNENEQDEFDPGENISKQDAYKAGRYYAGYLLIRKEMDEEDCPYGAVMSALAALIDAGKNLNISDMHELTVLNEKTYPWHVDQLETGEYGKRNCVLACIEMAFRYQNLADFPTAKIMREQYPRDGLGWNNEIAIGVMEEYGLDFTIGDSLEYNNDELLAELLKLIDEGNIIYTSYIRKTADTGHATIIKGYYIYGDLIQFIMGDPSCSYYGPYAYKEYLKDPYQLIEDIRRNIESSYLVISP